MSYRNNVHIWASIHFRISLLLIIHCLYSTSFVLRVYTAFTKANLFNMAQPRCSPDIAFNFQFEPFTLLLYDLLKIQNKISCHFVWDTLITRYWIQIKSCFQFSLSKNNDKTCLAERLLWNEQTKRSLSFIIKLVVFHKLLI